MIVPIDPHHEMPPRDIEMQEQGQEDGTTPPVLSPFPSAEGDHDQPIEEVAIDAHGGPNGVNGHIIEEEDMKMEDAEDVKDEAGPAPSPPTSPTPGAEEDSQGTNPDADEFLLLRTYPILQRGRGSIRIRTPLLLFPYVIFVTLRVLCCIDLDVLIHCISCV